MKISCPNCEWSAEVPDDKIPPKSAKGTCPKCQTKFEVKREETSPLFGQFGDDHTKVSPEQNDTKTAQDQRLFDSSSTTKTFKSKRKYIFILITVLILFSISAYFFKDRILGLFTTKNTQKIKYIPFKKNDDDRWGILDISTGKTVIDNEWQNIPLIVSEQMVMVRNKDDMFEYYKIAEKPTKIGDEYRFAGDFKEGIAVVAKKHESISFIDTNGIELLKIKELDGKLVESIGAFYEGLAKFKNEDNKWGFINKSGKIIIKPKYDYVSDFHEGMAKVIESSTSLDNHKSKSGFVDSTGKEVLKLSTNITYHNVSEGMIAYSDDEGKSFGFLNTKGDKVIKPNKNFKEVLDFNNGFASFNDGDKWGIIDKKGEVIVRAKYDFAYVNNNVVFVSDNHKIGYLDLKGKELIKPEYESGLPFFAENTLVKDRNAYIIIDKKGKQVGKLDFKYTDDNFRKYIYNESAVVKSDYFDINSVIDLVIDKLTPKEINGINGNMTLTSIIKSYNISESTLSNYSDRVTGEPIKKLTKYAIMIPEFKFDQNVKEPIRETTHIYGQRIEITTGYRPNNKAKVAEVFYKIQFTENKAINREQEIFKLFKSKFEKIGFKPDTSVTDDNTARYFDDNGQSVAIVINNSNGKFVIGMRLN